VSESTSVDLLFYEEGRFAEQTVVSKWSGRPFRDRS
jgi:hypothetical protein